MTVMVFKYSMVAAVVVVAIAGGAWYLLAPPDVGQKEALPKTDAGTIEGTTMYPSDFNPAQRVCAQSVDDSSYERCTDVPEQDGPDAPAFSIKVAPGTYNVYAVLKDPADMGLSEVTRAYWTEYVTCGLHAGCTDHARLDVVVGPGQVVRDIRPHDWYDTR